MYTCVCVFVYIFVCVCVYMCVCVRLSSCMSIQGCVFLNSPATVSLSVFVHVTTAHRYTCYVKSSLGPDMACRLATSGSWQHLECCIAPSTADPSSAQISKTQTHAMLLLPDLCGLCACNILPNPEKDGCLQRPEP